MFMRWVSGATVFVVWVSPVLSLTLLTRAHPLVSSFQTKGLVKMKKNSIWNEFIAQKKLFGFVLIIMAIGALISFVFSKSNEFGDSFGWVNALFSGLAFAGLIVTLKMQRESIELQTKELSDTREEMKKQSKEFGAQSQLIEQQKDLLDKQIDQAERRNFDDEFYKLLDLWKVARDGLWKPANQAGTRGLAIGGGMYSGHGNIENCDSNEKYKAFYTAETHILAPYFTLLYRILKRLDQSNRPLDEQKEHIHTLRAHLTDLDKKLIILNCFHAAGKGMKPLVEKYTLLKGMSFDERNKLKEVNDKEFEKQAF